MVTNDGGGALRDGGRLQSTLANLYCIVCARYGCILNIYIACEFGRTVTLDANHFTLHFEHARAQKEEDGLLPDSPAKTVDPYSEGPPPSVTLLFSLSTPALMLSAKGHTYTWIQPVSYR